MSPRTRTLSIGISLLLVLLFPVAKSMLYIVDERELAVVFQFGDPVAERTKPGLYVKWPFIQEVRRLPKTYQFWEGTGRDEKLVDVTTSDSKKIEATIWAVWRITDPVTFVRTLRTEENAETRVKEFVRSTARDVLTTNRLAEIVRSTSRHMSLTLGLPESALGGEDQGDVEAVIEQAMAPEARQAIETGRKKLMEKIREDAHLALGQSQSQGTSENSGRGIELIDVGLSRVEFVPEVRNAAFDRLIALMEAIATKNRSEGDQRKKEIVNQAKADAEAIRGEGSEEANILKGEVEAELINKFAQAIEDSGGFYELNRTLELYKKSLQGPDTRLILSTDSSLLRLLTDANALNASGPSSRPPSSAPGSISESSETDEATTESLSKP